MENLGQVILPSLLENLKPKSLIGSLLPQNSDLYHPEQTLLTQKAF